MGYGKQGLKRAWQVSQKCSNKQAIRLPKAILSVAFYERERAGRDYCGERYDYYQKADRTKHRTLQERLNGFNGEYVFQEWVRRACGKRDFLMSYQAKQGDIVWISFDPQAGHEHAGRRHAIIVSNDSFNKFTKTRL